MGQKKNFELTIKELRKFKEFEEVSDEEAV